MRETAKTNSFFLPPPNEHFWHLINYFYNSAVDAIEERELGEIDEEWEWEDVDFEEEVEEEEEEEDSKALTTL